MSYEDCIDVVQEWVQAQGYLTTSFVDRGDPAAADFSTAYFTKDNAWHDLDLSGIIPEGAKAVLFTHTSINSSTSRISYFRRKGNVNSNNISALFSQVALVRQQADFVCPLDGDRKIQYRVSTTGWFNLTFTVKGWWV